jgi:hypothetical protein
MKFISIYGSPVLGGRASEGRNPLPRIHANFREKVKNSCKFAKLVLSRVEVFAAAVLRLPVKNGRAPFIQWKL